MVVSRIDRWPFLSLKADVSGYGLLGAKPERAESHRWSTGTSTFDINLRREGAGVTLISLLNVFLKFFL